jgi:hypothetical protein
MTTSMSSTTNNRPQPPKDSDVVTIGTIDSGFSVTAAAPTIDQEQTGPEEEDDVGSIEVDVNVLLGLCL